MIGLCKNTIKWPSILFDLGYDVQLIEQTINLSSAQKINPDLVVVSGKLLHVIVADCKSGGNIDCEQDDRYKKLASEDLKPWVTVHDPSQLQHIVCYVDNHANHDSLEPHTTLPFIMFGNDSIQGYRDFNNAQLNKKLHSSISLKGAREPTGYYPFSPNDDDDFIAPHVLRGVASYFMQKGRKTPSKINASEILRLIHPYDLLSNRHKAHLIKKIENMIYVFMKSNKEFKEQLLKIEGGESNTSTLQSLKNICEELITNYENQKRITDAF